MKLVILNSILLLMFSFKANAVLNYKDPRTLEIMTRIQRERATAEKEISAQKAEYKIQINKMYDQALPILRQKVVDLKFKKWIGMEVLIAASYPGGGPASLFGHALIRFVGDGDPLDDIVIGPEAFIDDMGGIDMAKGLNGGYKIYPNVMTLLDFLLRYQRYESRPAIRKIIPSTERSRLAVLDSFVDLLDNPKRYGKNGYKFVNNNCWTVIMQALHNAGFNIQGGICKDSDGLMCDGIPWLSLIAPSVPIPDIPTTGPSDLSKFLVSPFPNLMIPAVEKFYTEMKNLTGRDLSELEITKWTYEDYEALDQISTQSLYFLYLGPKLLPKQLARKVTRLLKSRELDLEKIYEVARNDPALYEVCKTKICVQKVVKASYATWSLDELIDAVRAIGSPPYDIDIEAEVAKTQNDNGSILFEQFRVWNYQPLSNFAILREIFKNNKLKYYVD